MPVLTRSKTKTNPTPERTDTNGSDQPEVPEAKYIQVKVCPELKTMEISPELIKIPSVYIKENKLENVHIFIKRHKSAIQIIKNLKNLKYKGLPKIIIIGNDVRQINDVKDRQTIINDYHVLPTAGHAGVNRTLNTIEQKFYWPKMKQDIRNFIKSCELCQKNKNLPTNRTPMIVTTTANTAFEKIYLDLVGPLIPDHEDNKYILTTQCELTKFITATPIKDKSASVVAKAFVEKVVLSFGVPHTIATDRGTEFMSSVFKNVCELLKIEKMNSTAYHHQSIGALENSHKTLGNFLRIYANNKILEWSSWMPYFQFAFNTTCHSETNYTPFELVFGKQCRLPSNLTDVSNIQPIYNLEDYNRILQFKLQTLQSEVRNKLLASKQKRCLDYNINKIHIKCNPNELVLIKQETGTKLESKFSGPFSVVRDLEPNVEINVNGKIETIHKDRIKKFNQ